MKDQSLIDQLKAARKVSTPLLAITTADPPATVASILRAFKGASEPPILQHDIIRGLVGLTDLGVAARAELVPDDGVMGAGDAVLQSPAEALAAATKLPKRALLLVHNANVLLQNEAVIQAACNLRDAFKADGRTVVFLDCQISLPAQLVQDVLILDEPLPSEAQIAAIIDQELKNAVASMKPAPTMPDEATKQRAVEALSGLAAFPVEQAVALSLLSGALEPEQLWARKRKFISQTRGLSIDNGRETFDDLGGLENAKTFGRALFEGRARPRAIVRIDEIEKMLGGASSDTSGVSQDALGTILREMEDREWAGLIAVGPPGCAKSQYSKTLGHTHGVPTFALDLGAAKGSLVGQSEERIRAAMKVILAVAGSGAFFVATCNKLDALPPELRRRFRYGLWFFDLPTADERAAIWAIHLARFELSEADAGPKPSDTDWTGADIRNVCELAWRMRKPLIDAARFIVPVAVSDPQSIDKLRTTAHGKFLSASHAGTYKHAKAQNVPAAGVVQSVAVGRSYGGDS
jgi:hypothetical protein